MSETHDEPVQVVPVPPATCAGCLDTAECDLTVPCRACHPHEYLVFVNRGVLSARLLELVRARITDQMQAIVAERDRQAPKGTHALRFPDVRYAEHLEALRNITVLVQDAYLQLELWGTVR